MYNQQHKVEIEYSEGESGSEFIIKIRNLKPKARLQRIVFLWNKVFTRSKAATKIINSFQQIYNDFVNYGSTRHLLMRQITISQKAKRLWFVMNSESRFRVLWNICILVFVFYTAAYGPYKIAFVEKDGPWINAFESLMDVFFLIDMALSFITEYTNEQGQRVY